MLGRFWKLRLIRQPRKGLKMDIKISKFIRLTKLTLIYVDSKVSEWKENEILLNTERIKTISLFCDLDIYGHDFIRTTVITDDETYVIGDDLDIIESKLNKLI